MEDQSGLFGWKPARKSFMLPTSNNRETDMQRLNILCYIDGNGFHIARALEMNRIGGGESWQEALNELLGCIDAQVTYTQTNGGDMSLIWNPAQEEYFARYQKAKVTLTDNEPLDRSLYKA